MRDAAAAPGAVTIGIVAGEASGDALAATLIRALRERLPHARFVGIAGPRMEARGLRRAGIRWRCSRSAALVEVLSRTCRRCCRCAARSTAASSPSGSTLFVGVDAPDFNLGLERKLKRAGVRTVHFVSPSVWAWRRERVRKIGRSVDRVLALFPFEPPIYEAAGVPVTFVGHPLAAHAADHASRRDRARASCKLPASAPVFALLPGSRRSELEMHDGADPARGGELIHAARPDARFLVPLGTAPDARPLRRGALPAGPRGAAADAAVRPRDRRAARGRRRARRVGHGDARGGAGALPARHLLSAQRADRAHRRVAAAGALGGAAQRARRPLRRAGAAAGRRDAGEPRAGGAQSLRRHGDAAPARGAVRRHRRHAGGGHRDARRARARRRTRRRRRVLPGAGR